MVTVRLANYIDGLGYKFKKTDVKTLQNLGPPAAKTQKLTISAVNF